MSAHTPFNSPFYQAFAGAADLVIVNVLTVIGCIPLITAGASLTACTRVTAEIACEENPHIVRLWWKSFRESLRQSFIWWSLVLMFTALGLVENYFVGQLNTPLLAGALSGLLFIGLVSIVALLIWLIPLVAFFENRIVQHFANALILMLTHPKTTFVSLALICVPIGLTIILPSGYIVVGWFMVLIGVSFIAYLIALLQKSVFTDLRGATMKEA